MIELLMALNLMVEPSHNKPSPKPPEVKEAQTPHAGDNEHIRNRNTIAGLAFVGAVLCYSKTENVLCLKTEKDKVMLQKEWKFK